MKILIAADMPDDKAQAFFQTIRDFDVANSGCRFEIIANTNVSIADAVEMVKVSPALAIQVFDRTSK